MVRFNDRQSSNANVFKASSRRRRKGGEAWYLQFNQTTNIIMASRSNETWQSVLNRTVRMLVSGPFAFHLLTAVATVR
ncbi:hypothetical protein KIN20_030306 [Parelaphostrongylus tenuis]|uniref:Uncharacterized protein n=1 Tax=Parelaphostrongylus tenuis TaxID=148309 RepID=A0AAD5R3N3_PARTN|nr:hypothetical protein KIN20_030306 [Parelaphostrongylus tenuis]